MIQNTEDNKSFFWHQHKTLQIWVNTYVNPAELGANQSTVPFLSCC